MKFVIFKNPVILAIFTNTISLILFIYSTRETGRENWLAVALVMAIIIVGGINRQIIAKGQGMNIKKKIAIWISFYLSITIAALYTIFK